jgi:transposase-like protein
VSRRYLKLEQWRSLIEQHEASGESVTQFCRRHDLTPKTFWNRRKALREADQGKGMVVVAPPAASAAASRQLSVAWRGVELALAGSASPAWVAQLMRELADASVS